MTPEISSSSKVDPGRSSSVVREPVFLETQIGRVTVERQCLFRQGDLCEMVYLINQSDANYKFHWDIFPDGTAENDHRLVPKHLRGQGLAKAIMQDAEAFLEREHGVTEFWFKSMKTESLSFALSQGYEMNSDVESELFERALKEQREWLHDQLMARVFHRVFGLMPSLKKEI